MLTLTDQRVQCDLAPFDHPSLFVVKGHREADRNRDQRADDIVFELPEVGAEGYEIFTLVSASPTQVTFLQRECRRVPAGNACGRMATQNGVNGTESLVDISNAGQARPFC